MFSAKKSLYIFLTALLGSLLFLVLHRIAVFGYMIMLYYNYPKFSFGMSIMDFMALDYLTLIITLLLGGWYGIWLGLGWFEAVYEDGGHAGFFGHVLRHYFPIQKNNYGLKNKVVAAGHKLEHDLIELEELAAKMQRVSKPKVAVRTTSRIVRRKTK